jgi:hypothetical protein
MAQLYDELAERIGIEALEFCIQNALDNSSPTVTGQVLVAGVGIRACLEALRPAWKLFVRQPPNLTRAQTVRCVAALALRECGTAEAILPSQIRQPCASA